MGLMGRRIRNWGLAAVVLAAAAGGVFAYATLRGDAPAAVVATAEPEAAPVRPSYVVYVPPVDPEILRKRKELAATITTVPTTPAPEPVPEAPKGEPWIVVAEAVNVRSGPTNGAEVLGRMMQGEVAFVVETAGGWLRAESEGGTKGWVYSRYLRKQE